MKIVKAFSNKKSNDYCLQACVQSVLDFYFKDREFKESEIDLNTQYHKGHFSWSPATVDWLNSLGLDVKFYIPSNFDYEKFANDGLDYLRKILPPASFDMMSKRGDYTYVSDIQKSANKIIKSGLLINAELGIDKLENILRDEKSLAIGKTMHEWLDGDYRVGTNHYTVIVKNYSPGKWLIEDPGLPFRPNRKISQYINNYPMFVELIVIRGVK